MAFPPQFLDELRGRLSLASIVGRQVRLIKRGRGYVGLCPFHNEKSPSFNVVEDKGFFHCFGCGAHGDVIGFAMQANNLSFPEAIETLAAEAGLEVPKPTAEDRERHERQSGLQAAMEAACAWFEAQLAASHGRNALAYLEGRGLDRPTIKRFRLGFAPEDRGGLKRALLKDFPEPLLVEGGLLRRPEGGGETYDYFRNRAIFPIGDRAGKIIAFGGRVMGEGQPKYLNSPETPLFQKGRTLYGWAAARAGAARNPSVIVTEGYMDVIALHRAGFDTAVAPLGTALTEMQIEELWRLASEPVICFDGDAAGTRAAARALDRALPLLKPGLSLRFAGLPAGEDPDTLILRQGKAAMQGVLDRALPMAEMVWAIEAKAQPVDTPERRAAFEKRLEERARAIADKTVQDHYRQFFKEKLYGLFAARRAAPQSRGGQWQRQGRRRGFSPEPQVVGSTPADPNALIRRQQEILLATLINHPDLLHEFAEDLASLEFPAADLDKLSREILHIHGVVPDLDAGMLERHLCSNGFTGTVESLLSPQVMGHCAFARRDAEIDVARSGWLHARDLFQDPQRRAQRVEAERDFANDMTEEGWARFQALNQSAGNRAANEEAGEEGLP